MYVLYLVFYCGFVRNESYKCINVICKPKGLDDTLNVYKLLSIAQVYHISQK